VVSKTTVSLLLFILPGLSILSRNVLQLCTVPSVGSWGLNCKLCQSVRGVTSFIIASLFRKGGKPPHLDVRILDDIIPSVLWKLSSLTLLIKSV